MARLSSLCIFVLLIFGFAVVVKTAVVDIPWPITGINYFSISESDSLHFHWTGLHNVLQIATWDPPVNFTDQKWPNELRSGDKVVNGTYDWAPNQYPGGYRPGIYFFAEQDLVSTPIGVSFTIPESNTYYPEGTSCSSLSTLYGGRYSNYASRVNCSLYEVNNFQTEAHFDWVPPIFTAKQGDIVIFRWTGLHNIVQVHDATKDTLVPGGITSGNKTNCVGGPDYSCVNIDSSLGEYVFDTLTYRPGVIHISDECAYTCKNSTTGMGMEVDLRFDVPLDTPEVPIPGTCCQFNSSKGSDCRLVEIYNDNDGMQFDYNIPVGRGDMVRIRWAGRLSVFQTIPNNDIPTNITKPGGLTTGGYLECTPGPNLSCLEGTNPEIVFDIEHEISVGNYNLTMYGVYIWCFYAYGDNIDGYSSQNTRTLLYLDTSIPVNPTPSPCPSPSASPSVGTTTTGSATTGATGSDGDGSDNSGSLASCLSNFLLW